ncbi:MAG: hypothetical protein EGR74_10090 [Ruminiclostridium sp.]|nr:hypothetical protein [Ruminiclostridium sp.]
MKNAKLELLKKISKYSKEDIIEALGRQCQADFIIRGILNDLEYIASKRVFDDYDKAIKEHKDAFEAYIEWKNQICIAYGDGKSVKLTNIPPEEITKGAALERALKSTAEAEQKLDKKISKMLNV